MSKWIVNISFYSLGKDEVGKPIDKEPIRREYDDAEMALADLNQSINTNEGSHAGQGCKKVIITPDNRILPLDAAYFEVFGITPNYRINVDNGYPKLKNATKKLQMA